MAAVAVATCAAVAPAGRATTPILADGTSAIGSSVGVAVAASRRSRADAPGANWMIRRMPASPFRGSGRSHAGCSPVGRGAMTGRGPAAETVRVVDSAMAVPTTVTMTREVTRARDMSPRLLGRRSRASYVLLRKGRASLDVTGRAQRSAHGYRRHPPAPIQPRPGRAVAAAHPGSRRGRAHRGRAPRPR